MWILTALVSCLLVGLSAATCSIDNVDNCIQPFTTKYDKLGIGHMDFALDDMCVDYQTMRSCFHALESSCDQQMLTLLIFQSLDDGVGYLCGSGKAVYEANKDCIQGIEPTNPALQSCTDSYNRDHEIIMWKMVFASSSELEKLGKEACELSFVLEDCRTDMLEDECNAEAAAWYRTYSIKIMKPFESMMSCSFPDTEPEPDLEPLPKSDCYWTDWLDMDDPCGTGDWEDLVSHKEAGLVKTYASPNSAECRSMTTGASYDDVGEELFITCTMDGLVCLNKDQLYAEDCQDYEVRYYICDEQDPCEGKKGKKLKSCQKKNPVDPCHGLKKKKRQTCQDDQNPCAYLKGKKLKKCMKNELCNPCEGKKGKAKRKCMKAHGL